MSYREEIRQLALLCCEARALTDDELDSVIAAREEVTRYFSGRERFASFGAEQLKRHRLRRQEFEMLTTEMLERRQKLIDQERSGILEADEYDQLEDSFFESPPIDSDEYIIRQILKDRKKTSAPEGAAK